MKKVRVRLAPLVCVGLIVTGTIARAQGDVARTALMVTATVRPSCTVETTPTGTGPTDVIVQCGKSSVARVRVAVAGVSPATIQSVAVTGSRSIDRPHTSARVQQRDSSFVQIDF